MADFYRIQTQTAWGRSLGKFAGWCAPPAGAPVLDVGSGPGLLAGIFAGMGCQACGIDLDEAALKAGLHPHLVAGEAQRLPFPCGHFAMVTASNLLFLVEDAGILLNEMGRVLAPGGQVCCLNPSEAMSLAAVETLIDERGLSSVAGESLRNWARLAESRQRWSQADLEMLFEQAGLRLVESRTAVGPGLARYARGVKANRGRTE